MGLLTRPDHKLHVPGLDAGEKATSSCFFLFLANPSGNSIVVVGWHRHRESLYAGVVCYSRAHSLNISVFREVFGDGISDLGGDSLQVEGAWFLLSRDPWLQLQEKLLQCWGEGARLIDCWARYDAEGEGEET